MTVLVVEVEALIADVAVLEELVEVAEGLSSVRVSTALRLEVT